MSGLILRKDINKEEFDMLKLETENVSQFLAYYALLLSTACQYGLISQIEAEEISKEILGAFNTKFENESRVMSNNMYVLTCYLLTMKNSEQVKTLSNNSAQDLFDKANIWFRNELDIIEKMLLEAKAQAYNLKDEIIITSFEEFIMMLQECKTFSKEGTNCDFKKVHQRPVCVIYQNSSKEEFSEKDYLQNLSESVKAFVTEISILNKLNPSELMKNLKSSNKREINRLMVKNEIKKKKLEEDLKRAKEILYKNLEKARKISIQTSKKLADLERKDREEFKKLKPDLEGRAFEKAFANWQESLPEEHFEIYNECESEFEISQEARQKYKKKEQEILRKLDALDKAYDKEFLDTESIQTIDMSLDTIFKIYAIIELQKLNPNIRIPLDSQELSDILEKFELAKAVQIVLATIKPNFSDVELDYLRKI